MEVNFDVLRMQGAHAFNRLVKELNRHIDGENIVAYGNDHSDTFTTGDIRNEIDDLRNTLATLLCLEDDESGIKSIDIRLEVFAPED